MIHSLIPQLQQYLQTTLLPEQAPGQQTTSPSYLMSKEGSETIYLFIHVGHLTLSQIARNTHSSQEFQQALLLDLYSPNPTLLEKYTALSVGALQSGRTSILQKYNTPAETPPLPDLPHRYTAGTLQTTQTLSHLQLLEGIPLYPTTSSPDPAQSTPAYLIKQANLSEAEFPANLIGFRLHFQVSGQLETPQPPALPAEHVNEIILTTNFIPPQ